MLGTSSASSVFYKIMQASVIHLEHGFIADDAGEGLGAEAHLSDASRSLERSGDGLAGLGRVF